MDWGPDVYGSETTVSFSGPKSGFGDPGGLHTGGPEDPTSVRPLTSNPNGQKQDCRVVTQVSPRYNVGE